METLKISDFTGLDELLKSGTNPDEIYVFGAPGSSPDWGLSESQAFTRDEALKMFADWYQIYRDTDEYDGETLDEYVDSMLDELCTTDRYDWVD